MVLSIVEMNIGEKLDGIEPGIVGAYKIPRQVAPVVVSPLLPAIGDAGSWSLGCSRTRDNFKKTLYTLSAQNRTALTCFTSSDIEIYRCVFGLRDPLESYLDTKKAHSFCGRLWNWSARKLFEEAANDVFSVTWVWFLRIFY